MSQGSKLQRSGPIKFSQINDAVGDVRGDNPKISLGEYYKDVAAPNFLDDNPDSANREAFGEHPNSGSPIGASDLYGDRGIFSFTLSGSHDNVNLRDKAIAAGWDGERAVKCDISAQIKSTSTSTPACTVGFFPRGITINISSTGKILGKGGNGAAKSGAPTSPGHGGIALLLDDISSYTINNRGYIAGGGGGGARSSRAGGGGGAGGGNGGAGGGVDGSGGDGTTQFSGGAGATSFGAKGGDGGYNTQTNVYGRGGGAGGEGGGYENTSDKRLKRNIVLVGTSKSGINIYEFNYIWSFKRYRGVIAQELLNTHAKAVKKCLFGFYKVNYDLIDVKFEKI